QSNELDTESGHKEASVAANPSDALNHSSHDTSPNDPKEVTIEAAIKAVTEAVTEAVTNAMNKAATDAATKAATKAVAEVLAKAALDTETTRDRLTTQIRKEPEIHPGEEGAIATAPVEQP